ncbi:Fic family protein [Glaciecola siphonariae]|uniref:Fic family protein n=1 Tax=Glaciecola siphonariae TaxID=521012 RepID=A0ABV9LSY3_9ALTE
MYIWELENWPFFCYQQDQIVTLLKELDLLHSKLKEQILSMPKGLDSEAQLNALIQNAIKTSEIEGEQLDVGSVRSSVAKHLGLNQAGLVSGTKQTDNLVNMLLQATANLSEPLSLDTLLKWQSMLFTDEDALKPVITGKLRGDQPMQVVSQRGRFSKVHFEAPPKQTLVDEMNAFLSWFNENNREHFVVKAAISHLWFLTLHPFDDGNGRIARAITDRLLAKDEQSSVRFYSLSAAIEQNKNSYYDMLETTQNLRSASQQQNQLDITDWLIWFCEVLKQALLQGQYRIKRVLAKSQFWYAHAQTVLSERQIKVLNRLLDNFGDEFIEGINASKYKGIAGVSKATATRDLSDLLNKNCIIQLDGGGRSTRYQVNIQLSADQ